MCGSAGHRAYVAEHADELDRIVLMIHLEHAGRDTVVEDGETVPGPCVPRWFFTSRDPELEATVIAAIEATDLRRSLLVAPDALGENPPTDAARLHLLGVPIVQFLGASGTCSTRPTPSTRSTGTASSRSAGPSSASSRQSRPLRRRRPSRRRLLTGRAGRRRRHRLAAGDADGLLRLIGVAVPAHAGDGRAGGAVGGEAGRMQATMNRLMERNPVMAWPANIARELDSAGRVHSRRLASLRRNPSDGLGVSAPGLGAAPDRRASGSSPYLPSGAPMRATGG